MRQWKAMAFAETEPVGQGQYIETVQRKKAGDKQRGSGKGELDSMHRDTASGAGAVHRDCPEKKGRG